MLLPTAALYILHQLRQNGYQVYIVGGAVRDLLLHSLHLDTENSSSVEITDFDFTTNAKPDQIISVFPDAFYENEFGTVSITHEHILKALQLSVKPTAPDAEKTKVIDVTVATKIHESLAVPKDTTTELKTQWPDYQITTYRSDEVYDDFRRPSSMTWGETLIQDLERRDFTINAMALEVADETLFTLFTQPVSESVEITTFSIIDPFHGQADIQAHVIRCVGEPKVRFEEDALRMLRAVRFAVQLNMHITDPTFEALVTHAPLASHISGERIRDELLKILKSNYPAEGIELLDQTGLLEFVIPELLAAKGVAQAGHHTTDVWTHSLDALRYTPARDPLVRLATLLHDIAKPQTQRFTPETITFYNHEIIGARMARQIADRLKMSRKEVQKIFLLVRYHMFHYQPHNTDAAIRRFMRNVGLENIDDILALREGDRLGSGARHTSWRLEEMKQRMQAQLHQPFDLKDLEIDGDVLMTELQLKPGPEIGTILHELFEMVIEKPELNTRVILLDLAQKKLHSQPS